MAHEYRRGIMALALMLSAVATMTFLSTLIV